MSLEYAVPDGGFADTEPNSLVSEPFFQWNFGLGFGAHIWGSSAQEPPGGPWTASRGSKRAGGPPGASGGHPGASSWPWRMFIASIKHRGQQAMPLIA